MNLLPQKISLAWLYAVDKERVPRLAQSTEFVVRRYRHVREPSYQSSSESGSRNVLEKTDVLKSVFRVKRLDQPGFDSLVIEEDADGLLWCIAVQNKFAQVCDGNDADIDRAVTLSKHELFEEGECASSRTSAWLHSLTYCLAHSCCVSFQCRVTSAAVGRAVRARRCIHTEHCCRNLQHSRCAKTCAGLGQGAVEADVRRHVALSVHRTYVRQCCRCASDSCAQ
jgi:hypothetical protein